jgi:transposase InsO family protein
VGESGRMYRHIHHIHKGIQYTTPPHVQVQEQSCIQISMPRVDKRKDHGYAACLIRTLKKVDALSDWQYFKGTPYPIDLCIRKEVYQHRHICSGLGYLPLA